MPSAGSLTADLRAWTDDDLTWALEQAIAFGHHEGIELAYEDLGGPPPFERTGARRTAGRDGVALGAELGHVFGEMAAGGVSDGSWAASQGLPTLDGLGPVGGEDLTPWGYIGAGSLATRCGSSPGSSPQSSRPAGLAARGFGPAHAERPDGEHDEQAEGRRMRPRHTRRPGDRLPASSRYVTGLTVATVWIQPESTSAARRRARREDEEHRHLHERPGRCRRR